MTRATDSRPPRARATPRPIGPTLFAGDPHGRLDQVFEAVAATEASCVVLLGDIEPSRPLEVELQPLTERDVAWYFIGGNHDADSDATAQRVWNPSTTPHNANARVITLPSGRRLAGLAGVWRASVWHPEDATARSGAPRWRSREEHARSTPQQERWNASLPPRKHLSSIYYEEFERLADMQADILVTHEAPGYHPHGFALLDDLARAMGVCWVIHGHHHDAIDSSAVWARQGFETHGVGLRGVSALWPDGGWEVIIKGELDDQRAAAHNTRSTP